MNSCILMAEIIQDPELRYTSDNQTPLAQMLVQFPGQRADDAPMTLKVVGWGNFASEIKENYQVGDRIVIEGRLGMNSIDRTEGFKEKRAELTASRIYKLGADTTFEPHVATPATSSYEAIPAEIPAHKSNNVVVPIRSKGRATPMVDVKEQDRDYAFSGAESTFEPTIVQSSSSNNLDQKDLDDIPF